MIVSKVCFKSAIIETDRPADIFMVTISLLRSDCMCRTGLYGLNNSNRDMSLKKHWGKNQFTTSFPMSVALFEDDKGFTPVYVKTDKNLKVVHDHISLNRAFNFNDDVKHANLRFDFESLADLDKRLNGKGSGNSTRSDVVVSYFDNSNNKIGDNCGMEIKLTTVPDNVTASSPHEKQSSEIVIRPVSILHLSNVLAWDFRDKKETLKKILFPIMKIFGENNGQWINIDLIRQHLEEFVNVFTDILKETVDQQRPVLMQCIWRTKGKKPLLEKNAFETFFWSSHAFSELFIKSANIKKEIKSENQTFDRKTRSIIWIIRMLCYYVENHNIPGEDLIHMLSYGNQTDKAFAANGKLTLSFLECEELNNPRVLSSDLDSIILGKGNEYLSPERRLDATLYIQSILNDRSN